MALSIKTEEADRLAREVVATTGESLTEAVTVALRERLQRLRARERRDDDMMARLDRLADEYDAAPLADPRSPDEIIDYDDVGLPR